MKKHFRIGHCMLAIAFLILFVPMGLGQDKTVVTPITGSDLKQLCKSFEFVHLEVEMGKKDISSSDITSATACINFIVGVVSTVATMDVGYYPEMKIGLGKQDDKLMSFNAMVKPVLEYIEATPESEKKSAAAVVVVSLMRKDILVPKHWADK